MGRWLGAARLREQGHVGLGNASASRAAIQALVADAIVVSKTASNVDEAYEFAKWMTFSKEAYAKETAELAGSAPLRRCRFRCITRHRQFVDKPGVNAALDNLDSSVIESLANFVPGYVDAREGKPGIGADRRGQGREHVVHVQLHGKFKYEDYAERLETFANKSWTTRQRPSASKFVRDGGPGHNAPCTCGSGCGSVEGP